MSNNSTHTLSSYVTHVTVQLRQRHKCKGKTIPKREADPCLCSEALCTSRTDAAQSSQ